MLALATATWPRPRANTAAGRESGRELNKDEEEEEKKDEEEEGRGVQDGEEGQGVGASTDEGRKGSVIATSFFALLSALPPASFTPSSSSPSSLSSLSHQQ